MQPTKSEVSCLQRDLPQAEIETAKHRRVFRPKGSWAMKYSKRSFAVVSVLFAVLLSSSAGKLHAGDHDLASLTFAAARTAKQQCINTCRARYRDCLSLKQIPSFECRGIYQDCTRNTCTAGPSGRPSWQGFPSWLIAKPPRFSPVLTRWPRRPASAIGAF